MHQTESNNFHGWRLAVGAAGFFLIIGFLLFTEHRAHVIAVLPWLILLACPLLHPFMHGGHGGHGTDHGQISAQEDHHESR